MLLNCLNVEFYTTLFSHNKQEKSFVAEASTIGLKSFARLYDDACDEGCMLTNPKTLKSIFFYLHKTHKDADGDITHWELYPVVESIRKCPAILGYSLIIFND